ncbi:hypothetical protein [Curtobacterium sp. ISL-83]|uniref:hypothetical protein n=1 Tax=Curtobacterium sp. ISL-83 TaxID=2819145 RepID=UPI001BEADE10|nr:hypothetical protein [Curtobacterium sp. ISL-83]MBT2503382.1 hypothetical protein [Curtobacterium sp. ISL-83]
MASEPQQRASRRSAPTGGAAARKPAGAAARTSATARNPGAAAARNPSGAAARNPSGAAARNTDEFARLMQRNTVDTRQQSQAARRRNPIVGKIALGLAVVSAAVDASAFAVYMGGDTTFAFGICFVVVFLTLIAAVLGFIAAVGSFGRWYGAIGVVVAFVANPVILIVLVVFVAPEVLTDMGG